jgi:hypothetical protein
VIAEPGNNHRSEPRFADARLHYPQPSSATRATGGQGSARRVPWHPEGTAHPRHQEPHKLLSAMPEATEMHPECTAKAAKSSLKILQGQLIPLCTGVFPMLCIGRMEPFHRLDCQPTAWPACHHACLLSGRQDGLQTGWLVGLLTCHHASLLHILLAGWPVCLLDYMLAVRQARRPAGLLSCWLVDVPSCQLASHIACKLASKGVRFGP